MRNALILGAGSDVAQALAHALARAGYSLTLAARRPEALKAMADDLAIRYQAPPELVAFDALAMESHPDFYRQLKTRPDLVACVFGYLGDQALAERDFREARRVLDTNFTGAVSILEVIAADFEARRDGAIIGISSVAGERGRQSNYMYGCAKAGFSAFLSGLRNRLFHAGVHVMTVKPGFIYTRMTAGIKLPAAVTAQPEQVAADILRGLARRRDVVYTRWYWRWIMAMIRAIPETLFKRLKL